VHRSCPVLLAILYRTHFVLLRTAITDASASLTVSPPPIDISCPPGQRLELASLEYTNVVLTDTTNNVSISLPNFSSGCLLPNVRGACD
jgi:hypothetical protein